MEGWSTPRDIAPEHDSPRGDGRSCGASDKGPSGPGQLVNPAFPRTQVRVTRDSWSTPRVFKQWPETRGTAGQHRGPLDPSSIRRGELVKSICPRTQARVARDSLSTPGPSDPGPRRMDSWWTPRALGLNRELRERAGRNRVPSDTSASHPGQLVNPVLSQTWAESARDIWSNT